MQPNKSLYEHDLHFSQEAKRKTLTERCSCSIFLRSDITIWYLSSFMRRNNNCANDVETHLLGSVHTGSRIYLLKVKILLDNISVLFFSLLHTRLSRANDNVGDSFQFQRYQNQERMCVIRIVKCDTGIFSHLSSFEINGQYHFRD
jgi:hypothetical protein